jgi:hypothetical protein
VHGSRGNSGVARKQHGDDAAMRMVKPTEPCSPSEMTSFTSLPSISLMSSSILSSSASTPTAGNGCVTSDCVLNELLGRQLERASPCRLEAAAAVLPPTPYVHDAQRCAATTYSPPA